MIGAIQGGKPRPQEVVFENISLGANKNYMGSKDTTATRVIGWEIYNSATGGNLSSGCHLYQCFIEDGKLHIALTNMATVSAKVDIKVFVE